MASKPKRNGSRDRQAAPTAAAAEQASPGSAVGDEDVRRRAYEIYLERGAQPGRDLDDWLQAERELASGALRRAQAG